IPTGQDIPASLSPTGYVQRSLHTLAETALRRVGPDIAAFVSSVWSEGATGKVASGFAFVLRSGGGAYQIGELQTLIRHARVSSAPHEDNALGYAALANRLRQYHPGGEHGGHDETRL